MQSLPRITTYEVDTPDRVWRLLSIAVASRLRQAVRGPQTRSPVALRAGSSTKLRDGQGCTLVCRRGVAWVTQNGVYDDYILYPGQSLRTAPLGSVVMTAVADVELEIVMPL